MYKVIARMSRPYTQQGYNLGTTLNPCHPRLFQAVFKLVTTITDSMPTQFDVCAEINSNLYIYIEDTIGVLFGANIG